MTFVDLALILVIAGFVFFGLFFGFIRTVGSLLGTIVGVLAAFYLTDPLFEQFGHLVGGAAFAKIIIFFLVFAIASRLVWLLVWVIEKAFHVVKVIPFTGMINRLLGAGFGLIEGVVAVSTLLLVVARVLPFEVYNPVIGSSVVAQGLLRIGGTILGFIPESILVL